MRKLLGTREERRARRKRQLDAVLEMLGTEREVAWRVGEAAVAWDGGPGNAHLFYKPPRGEDVGAASGVAEVSLPGQGGFFADEWVCLGQIPSVLSSWDLDVIALELGIRRKAGLLLSASYLNDREDA